MSWNSQRETGAPSRRNGTCQGCGVVKGVDLSIKSITWSSGGVDKGVMHEDALLKALRESKTYQFRGDRVLATACPSHRAAPPAGQTVCLQGQGSPDGA